MGRKIARAGLMQCLYAKTINEKMDNNGLENIFGLLNFDEDEIYYINQGLDVIENNLQNIDRIILESLKGWTLERLSKIDLTIMRVAVYEIIYRKDIPNEVAINEAVEISKLYSTDEAYKFINGVLGNVVRTI